MANAHAAKVTREGEIRTGRSGSPPASRMSKVSVSAIDLPAARFRPKSSFRLVNVSVASRTDTAGRTPLAASRKPDVPGCTVR